MIDYASILDSSACVEGFILHVEQAAIQEYREPFPEEREIVSFIQGCENCTFDLPGKEFSDFEARVVFIWAKTVTPDGLRDGNYQSGYPIKEVCVGRSLDRGHYIPFSGGGSFGPNLFQQDRALNRGLSKDGRAFRSIEAAASKAPGSLYFVRPSYVDNSAFPAFIETGALIGGKLTTGRFQNRFDAPAVPKGINSKELLDILLPAMSKSDFGMLGEEAAAVWLEEQRDAIIVSLEDQGFSRGDRYKDLDIVAILGEDLICYEVKTRLLSKSAGKLTLKGNLRVPRLGHTSSPDSRQASQLYMKQRLDYILDTDPEFYEGIESRVIAVDLKAMLIQEFLCNDNGRIVKPVDYPYSCYECVVEALDRLRGYLFSRKS